MNPSTLSSSPVSTHKTELYCCSHDSGIESSAGVGASLESACDESYDAVEEAFRNMQRAMVRWDIFGTFDCAADYTLARAKWLRLKSYSQGGSK